MAHFVDAHGDVGVPGGGGGSVAVLVGVCDEGLEFFGPVTDVVGVVEVGCELFFALGFLVAETEDEFVEGGGAGGVALDA